MPDSCSRAAMAAMFVLLLGTSLHTVSAQTAALSLGDSVRVIPMLNPVHAAISPDGATLVCQLSSAVVVLDLGTGQEIRRYAQHSTQGNGLFFYPDGANLLSVSYRAAHCWNWSTGETKWSVPAEVACLSPDGRYVAIIDSENVIRLLDATTGTFIRIISYRGFAANALSFGLNDSVLVLPRADPRYTVLFRVSDGSVIDSFAVPGPSTNFRSRFNAASDRFILMRSRPTIVDAATGDSLFSLDEDLWKVYDASFSPDGKYIATYSFGTDFPVKLWNATTGKLVKRLGDHNSIGYTCIFTPDGKYVLTTSIDSTIRLWPVPQPGSAVEDERGGVELALKVFPEPIRGDAAVSYGLDRPGRVRVSLVDEHGSLVRVLVDEVRESGRYSAALDVRGLPSGVYLCVLTVDDRRTVRPFRLMH